MKNVTVTYLSFNDGTAIRPTLMKIFPVHVPEWIGHFVVNIAASVPLKLAKGIFRVPGVLFAIVWPIYEEKA